jgi:hypothetical protein
MSSTCKEKYVTKFHINFMLIDKSVQTFGIPEKRGVETRPEFVCAAVSPQGTYIYGCDEDGTLYVFLWRTGTLELSFKVRSHDSQ